ncbi:MAG TPA: FKBP-type peptidyl-prolyl cis-trans isomerase [Alphaproteobacteria bacterium]|nr:FKBP-type peptidyl-prolyl cis-trans isomerase [Alphaproteobacteria bacterium]
MKKASLILIALAGAALFTGCNNQQTPPASGATNSTSGSAAPSATTATPAESASTSTNVLSTEKDRESYAIGMSMGMGLKNNLTRAGLDMDLDLILRGIKDSESGGPTLLTEDQMKTTFTQIQRTAMMNRQKIQSQEAQKNQAEGEAFLAHNKTLPGVVTLTNGLQYKVITDGTGAIPGPNDMVTVDYRGTHVDGKEFDSSYRRGRPLECNVGGGIIRGWTEALERMKVGSKWEVYIPPNLAYGPMGYRDAIGPNETLIFEMELLGVKSRPAPPQAQPLTSDIIEVPSADQIKKGAKIQTIKASDAEKMQEAATNSAATNQAQ